MSEEMIECTEIVGKVVKCLKLYRSDPDAAELQIDFEDGTSFSCFGEQTLASKPVSFGLASVPQKSFAITSDRLALFPFGIAPSLNVIGHTGPVILVLRHADAPGQRRCKVDQILPARRSDKSAEVQSGPNPSRPSIG